MATIGNLAVAITANAEQYLSTLNMAAKKAKAFAADTMKNLQSAGATNNLASILTGGNAGDQLKGLGKNLLTAIPGVGGALGTGVQAAEGLFDKIRQTQQAMGDQGKAAMAAGANIEGYSGILFAAGGNAELVDKMLFKLNETVGDAALNGGVAKDYFNQLGLSVSKLSTMKADERFLAVDRALVKVTNDAVRAKLAEEAFGKSAREGMAFLNKGPDWIKQRRCWQATWRRDERARHR